MIIKTIAKLLLFLGLSTSVFAQFGANTARRVVSGTAAPPATCNASPVDLYARTGATSPGLYMCLSANTWTGPLSSAAAGLSSATVSFGSPTPNTYTGYSYGANSFPPRINGITGAGNYPPVPATGYGYAAIDVGPALFTAPPPTVAGTSSRSIMGINSAIATAFPDSPFNVFAINGQIATPSTYNGNQWAWYGMYHENDHNGGGTLHVGYSVFGADYNSGNGTCTNCVGGHFESVGNFYAGAFTPLTTQATGLECNSGVNAGATHTNDYCLLIMTPFTGGTFTNGHIGIQIDDQTNGGAIPVGGTYAIRVGAGNATPSGQLDWGANTMFVESTGTGFLAMFAPTGTYGSNNFKWPLTTQSGAAAVPLEVINAATSQRAESGADANLLTFTPPTQTGSYRICFALDISAANTATLGWTATWTDSNG